MNLLLAGAVWGLLGAPGFGQPRTATDYARLAESFLLNDQDSLAWQVLFEGIAAYPDSGVLYRQAGLAFLRGGQEAKAVQSWAKGAALDPTYPENYLHLMRYYGRTNEQVWAWLFAERLAGLSDDPAYGAESARFLWAAIAQRIVFPTERAVRVSLTERTDLVFSDAQAPRLQPEMAIQTNLQAAIASSLLPRPGRQALTLAEWIEASRDWLATWEAQGLDSLYALPVIQRYQQLAHEGYWSAYWHWRLQSLFRAEATAYAAAHPDEWAAWLAYPKRNPFIAAEPAVLP